MLWTAESTTRLFTGSLLLLGVCRIADEICDTQGKPFCIGERQSEGKPIVFKYRNYDLYLYKPDYEGEEELVFLFRFHHL